MMVSSSFRDRWAGDVLFGIGLWTCSTTILLIIYQESLTGPYIFDDLYTFNEKLRAGIFPDTWDWLRPQTRPLLAASFCITHHFWSSPIVGHRIGNVCIHALNFVLLYFLITRYQLAKRNNGKGDLSIDTNHKPEPMLSPSNRQTKAFGIDCFALCVAGLWLVHPLCSQCVAYLSQRAESLMATFFLGLLLLLGLRTCHKFAQSILMVLLFSLGMYTKTVMLSALAVVPLFDRAYIFDSWKDVLRNRLFFYVVIVGSGLAGVAVFLPDLRVGRSGIGFGGESPSLGIYLLTEVAVLFNYVELSLWPMRLSIDREPQFITRPSEVFVQILAFTGWVATAAYLWGRKALDHRGVKPIAFLLITPLLILAPSSSFVPTADPMFEHRFYLPLAFVIWLFAELIERLRHNDRFVYNRSTNLVRGIGVLLLVGFATRSFFRATDYATSERIWASAVTTDPGNSRAAQNFVAAIVESDQSQSTLDVLTEMLIDAELAGKADDALAHQVAKERLSLGDTAGAIKILVPLTKQTRRYDECITDRQRREYGELWFDLAVAYTQGGRPVFAISAIKNALIATPVDPIAHQLTSELYQQIGKNELAFKHLKLAEQFAKNVSLD